MEIQFNTSSVGNLASLAEAIKSNAAVAADAAPILSGESLNVSESSPDLDSLLAKLLAETTEAKLNAARSRLSSALGQLTNLGEADKKKVGEMRELAESQAQAEKTLEERGQELDVAAKELAGAEKALDDAKGDFASAEKTAAKAEKSYNEAKKTLEDYKNTAETIDSTRLAELEAAVASAKQTLDSATAKVGVAEKNVASAQKRMDEAVTAHEAAQAAYDAASGEVDAIQSKFDALLESLDASSLTALREAVRLDAGDIDHLHDEIEEDDKKHDLASVKAVEDVISDALDRIDGKMVDEVADRHLDHV